MVRPNHRPTLGLKVSVDTHSGFCYGVVRAIRAAERQVARSSPLYSLGAIVHNNEELHRLRTIGLHTIDTKDVETLHDQSIIIRAHGAPPDIYAAARRQHLHLIDCTCPVVLKLQQQIKEEFDRIKPKMGQIVIFGRRGHAEVIGLVGQIAGDAHIIEQSDQIDHLDYSLPLTLFSQTTQDPESFLNLCRLIETRYRQNGVDPAQYFRPFNTICTQVAERQPMLRAFAQRHDTLIFVCGKESSNGKVLFDACKMANGNSYRIENSTELNPEWFSAGTSVGVCGATSTPKWLMEEVAATIKEM